MNYKVLVNGKEVACNYARVSKVPFNMVWKGYQRDVDQTELAWFVSFDMEGKTDVEIQVLDANVEDVKIKPLEFGIDYTVQENVIYLSLDCPKKFVVEVNGTHETLNVFANEKDNFVPDENTIYFGPGEHDAGFIFPKSGQTVYLAEGAVVYGGIYAYKADNVTVCGRGILDSSRIPRGDEIEEDSELYKLLSSLTITDRDIKLITGFTAYECNNFTVDGIVVRDAPFWSMIIRNGSRNVKINNVKIIGQWRYNADGIDLCASGNIMLTDCFVRSFDDSIVVRAVDLDNETTPCDNILVENNILWCDWGKNLEIWCGDKNAVVKDVIFRNNYLVHVAGIGISIDTWFGAPSLLVDNILYENIYIDSSDTALPGIIQEYKEHKYPNFEKAPYDPRRGVVVGIGRLGKNLGNQACDFNYDCSEYKISYKNVTFRNVVCSENNLLPAKINPENLYELSNIAFENCRLGKITYN